MAKLSVPVDGDRLLRAIDQLIADRRLTKDFFAATVGYSSYAYVKSRCLQNRVDNALLWHLHDQYHLRIEDYIIRSTDAPKE